MLYKHQGPHPPSRYHHTLALSLINLELIRRGKWKKQLTVDRRRRDHVKDNDNNYLSVSLENELQQQQQQHFKDSEMKTANTTKCSNYNNEKDVNCRFNKDNLGYQHRHRHGRRAEGQQHPVHHYNYHHHHRNKWWWNGIIFYMCHVLFITSAIALSDSNSKSDGNSDGASSNQDEQHIKYSTNIIETRFGAIRGIIVGTNPSVDAYLGVPYASPPVGSLR